MPLEELRIDLFHSDRLLGTIARLRDVLPGRYAFGLTGRGPRGRQLPRGDTRSGSSRRRSPARRTREPCAFTSDEPTRRRRILGARERRRSRTMSATESVSHLRENPLELAQAQLRRVGEVFAIDPNLISVLSGVKKCVEVGVPVRMDDGSCPALRGVPRHAQHRARAVQGRHPLSPGGDARRDQGARDGDDLEMLADGSPVRRREGRHRRATRRRSPAASSSA